jgi:hypothetical protein
MWLIKEHSAEKKIIKNCGVSHTKILCILFQSNQENYILQTNCMLQGSFSGWQTQTRTMYHKPVQTNSHLCNILLSDPF